MRPGFDDSPERRAGAGPALHGAPAVSAPRIELRISRIVWHGDDPGDLSVLQAKLGAALAAALAGDLAGAGNAGAPRSVAQQMAIPLAEAVRKAQAGSPGDPR